MSIRLNGMILITLFVLPITVSAQDGEEMVTRVYRVADLIRRVPDYPYQSGIPTTETGNSKTLGLTPGGSSPSGAGGGGGGGFGGGGGGGFFQIGDQGGGFGSFLSTQGQNHELSLHGLINVIMTSIAPDTWRDNGGEGRITALGTSLVVRQMPSIQEQIEELLAALREQSDSQKMVTIELFLVTWQPEDRLSAASKFGEDADQREKALQALREEASYSGQLTCFSGQEVHLASGHRRSIVTSAIPVVSALAVGYQPVITTPHIGTLVQMTPTLDFQDTSATIDLRCTLTEWSDEGRTITIHSRSEAGSDKSSGGESQGSETSAQIQQPNIGTRQLATTVRVPATAAGETPIPVIVGTLGEPPRSDSDVDHSDELTYLILAVSQAEVAHQP